ncbi:MAG: helix-turn-helix transcriptional regulator [Bacteroidales bacterium]
MNEILTNIILIRKERGLSQENMADELKMTQGGYSAIEMGRRELKYNTIQQIALIFKLRVIDIITWPEIYENIAENKKTRTKVLVELDIREDEFIKFGLKEKLVQILNK